MKYADGRVIFKKIVDAIQYRFETDPGFAQTCNAYGVFNKDNEITKSGIAKLLDVKAQNVGRWETGSVPDGSTLIQISQKLDCSLDYLIGRSETLNYELNDIHAATGLSEPAIDQLREYANKMHQMENGKRTHWTQFFLRDQNVKELQAAGYNIRLASFEIIPDLISFVLTYKSNGRDSTLLELIVQEIAGFNTQLIWYSIMDDLSRSICEEAYKEAEERMKKYDDGIPYYKEQYFVDELTSVVHEHAAEIFDPNREPMEFESLVADDSGEEFHLGILAEEGKHSESHSPEDALNLVVNELKTRFKLIHDCSDDGIEERASRIRDRMYKLIARYMNINKEETVISFVSDKLHQPAKKK